MSTAAALVAAAVLTACWSSPQAKDELAALQPPASRAPATSTDLTGWACPDHDPLDLANAAIDGLLDQVRALSERCIPDPAGSVHEEHALGRAAHLGQVEVVTHLLEFGADPNVADSSGTTPLLWAARWLHAEQDTDPSMAERKTTAAWLLLEAGADVTDVAEGGDTALHWAAFAGHAVMMADLVVAGAEIDVANDLGRTPLMVAASVGREREVVRLLELGADAGVPDADGLTARDLAAVNGHVETVAVLDDWATQE